MSIAGQVLSIVIKGKDEFSKVASEVSKNTGNWKKNSMAAGAAMTAMGAASGAALKSARTEALSYGREVVNIQRLTGMTAEESSKLASVFNRLGVDQKQAGLVMKTLAQNISSNSDALQTMGVSTRGANGEMRNQAEVLKDVAEYYKNAENKTEALANVSKVLGKGYQTLLPILSSGAEGIDKITAAADKNGMILNDKALKAVKDYGGAMKDNEQAAKGLEIQMGLLTLPFETFKAKALSGLLEQLNALPGPMKGVAGGALIMTEAIGKSAGPILMAIPALSSMGVSFAGIGATITGAIGGIGTAVTGFGAVITGALSGVVSSFGAIAAGIAGATGAAATALVALAGAIGFGIGMLLNRLEPVKKVQQVLGEWIGGAFFNTSQAFKNGFAQVGTAFTTVRNTVRDFFKMLKGGETFISAFKIALTENMGVAGERVGKVFQKLIDSFNAVMGFVKAVPGAFKSAFDSVLSAITGPVDQILAKIRSLNPFQRHSPSLVDNVLAGTRAIANAYAGLGGLSVPAPSLAGGGIGTMSYSGAPIGGGPNGGRDSVVKVFLDGRELNQGLARSAGISSRSGVR